MAAITQTLMTGTGARELTVSTLTASDTLTYSKGKGQVLTIMNDTAGALTLNIVGASATTVSVTGYGTVSLTAGYSSASIADGETFALPLDSISEFLKGTIAITGADACTATLTSY